MDKNKIIDVSAKIAMVLAVVCSTAYLLMLGWYNNLLLDDYGFVADVDQNGAWGLMRNAYLYWQSRFSAFYVLGWIMKIWGHASNLIGYTILLLVIGYATIYYALRRITNIQEKWFILGLAMLINNVSIMAYLEMSTFFWVCCALYTLSTYAAILLFTVIFYSKGKDWLRWIAVMICSLYICGGAENFTPIIIAALGCILLYKMISQHTWRFWQTKEQKMMLVSLAILSLGFIAVVLGPGTSNRVGTINSGGFMAHFAFIPYCIKLAKASAIFGMRLLSRGLYYVLLIPVGIWMGQQMKGTVDRIRKHVLIAIAVALCSILLSIAAPVFGMGWYAPLRAYCLVSFIVVAMVIYCAALVGLKLSSEHKSKILSIVASVMIAAMSICFMHVEQPIVANYHAQIAARNNTIQEQAELGRTERLHIDRVTHPAIPNSYALMRMGISQLWGKKNVSIAEPSTYFPYVQYSLSVHPDNWKNMDIKRYHDAQFDIIGWDEE